MLKFVIIKDTCYQSLNGSPCIDTYKNMMFAC